MIGLLVLYVLLVALNGVDIYSTYTILVKGKGYEANPVMKFLMDKFAALIVKLKASGKLVSSDANPTTLGALLAMITTKGGVLILVAFGVWLDQSLLSTAVLGLLNLAYLYAAYNNLSILKKE